MVFNQGRPSESARCLLRVTLESMCSSGKSGFLVFVCALRPKGAFVWYSVMKGHLFSNMPRSKHSPERHLWQLSCVYPDTGRRSSLHTLVIGQWLPLFISLCLLPLASLSVYPSQVLQMTGMLAVQLSCHVLTKKIFFKSFYFSLFLKHEYNLPFFSLLNRFLAVRC